jgi:hypothetical protein
MQYHQLLSEDDQRQCLPLQRGRLLEDELTHLLAVGIVDEDLLEQRGEALGVEELYAVALVSSGWHHEEAAVGADDEVLRRLAEARAAILEVGALLDGAALGGEQQAYGRIGQQLGLRLLVGIVGEAVEPSATLQQSAAPSAVAPDEGIVLEDVVKRLPLGEGIAVGDVAGIAGAPLQRPCGDDLRDVGHQDVALPSQRGGGGRRHAGGGRRAPRRAGLLAAARREARQR